MAMENNTQIKQPYYVFMDIDGTLWDKNYASFIHGPFVPEIQIPRLKPESVNAINVMLENLEERFDTRLVITSGHRSDMAYCVNHLKLNGLKWDKPILCTPFTPGDRGEKIVDFMINEGQTRFTYPTLGNLFSRILYTQKDNQDFTNYVVIDDNKKLISKQIPPERRIITNKKNHSLSLDQVITYLCKNGIRCSNARTGYKIGSQIALKTR